MTVDTSDNKKTSAEKNQRERIIIHIFWIGVTISLIIALTLAYLDTRKEFATFSELFSKPNGKLVNHTTTTVRETVGEVSMPISINTNTTGQGQINSTGNVSMPISVNETTSTTTGQAQLDPANLKPPYIPIFIALWGYIGAACYVLKVSTIKIYSKAGFNKKQIPDHIARLFIGTAVAIVTFFILSTGGFFGLTIDFSKISNPILLPYAYGAVAFFSGYFVRHIISITSGIIDNVFLHDKRSKEEEKSGQ